VRHVHRLDARWRDGVPPEPVFIVAAVSLYVGSALAVHAFDRVDAVGVAWLRVLAAAVVLGLWRRPWRAEWTRRRLALSAVFGVVTASMNTCFYMAIAEIPLGTAVSIEFLGPVAVAAAFDRTRRNLVALAMVTAGVALASGVRWEGNAVGVAWALASAALWAGYIVFGSKVAAEGAGLDGLAAGLALGVVVLAPIGAGPASAAFGDAGLLLVCLGIGVLSNAVPYALDQYVLRRVTADRFALLLAILPVTAAVIGAVMLGQVLRPAEVVGIALVVVALIVRRRADSGVDVRPSHADDATLPG
jgi:inner membrane transporter RhtA